MENLIKAFGRGAPAVRESVKLGCKSALGGLQQARQIKMIGAESNAEPSQCRACFLAEAFDFLGDLRAVENAKGLSEMEGNAASNAIKPFAFFKLGKRLR